MNNKLIFNPEESKLSIDRAFNVAFSAHKAGNLELAANGYKEVLRLRPNHAPSLNLMGLIAKETRHLYAAVDLISRAIINNKNVPEYHYNLGVVYQELKEYDAAIRQYEITLNLDKFYKSAYCNLIVALQMDGQLERAEVVADKGYEIIGDELGIIRNVATVKFLVGKTRQALKFYNKALKFSSDDPHIHIRRSACLLKIENFQEGWKEYRWRGGDPKKWYKQFDIDCEVSQSLDYGGLYGMRVYLKREQGIGDEIMFASILSELCLVTEELVVQIDPRLTSIFRASFPSIKFVSTKQDVEQFDIVMMHVDLLAIFRRNMADFHREAYLVAQDKRYLFKDENNDKKIRVGIVWRGGVDPYVASYRSIPLGSFIKVALPYSQIELIPLQYDITRSEMDIIRSSPCFGIESGLDLRNDVSALASLIDNLDCVVGTDNSVIHLAGALGKKVYLLLHQGCDWRWFEGYNYSHWYKDVKIYRRMSLDIGDWCPDLEKVFCDVTDDMMSSQ